MGSVKETTSIAIIGAGIGGIALAIGLLKQNVRCTIYEAAPKFDAVGAGIGLGPNALRAMALMDDKFAKLFDEIKVGNTSPERRNEQIEILGAWEGFGDVRGSVGDPRFERSSAHRKALLEVMKSLIPEGTVVFSKRVKSATQVEGGGKVELVFEDGEMVSVDAVVGCDGIKGISRGWVLEEDYPEEVASKYCHEYVYRGIASMSDAKAIIGDYAEDARWFMIEGGGWAMYPISGGREVNIVAFIQDEHEWKGERAAREVTREEMMAEFGNFDHRLKKLLDYVKPAKWPLFCHPDTPTYYKGRICLLGDSAHASTPSQAAGAGQGLEDALILSRLLGMLESPSQVGTVFKIYDSIRRPRAQGVVKGGLEVGIQYFLKDPKYGSDLQKITDNANERLPAIWWHDLEGDVKKAENMFLGMTR